jgi:hypothetical protein
LGKSPTNPSSTPIPSQIKKKDPPQSVATLFHLFKEYPSYKSKTKRSRSYGGVALDLADDGKGAGTGVLELGVDGELASLGTFYEICPWQCRRLCCC